MTVNASYSADSQAKIATLNIQKAVSGSKAGQKALKLMEAKKGELEPKFQGDQDALKAQAKEIEKKSSIWSKEVKAEKEREYQKKMREYQLKVEDANYELGQLNKKVIAPIINELRSVVKEFGKREGISLILEKSANNPNTNLLYSDQTLDITDRIIKELDARISK